MKSLLFILFAACFLSFAGSTNENKPKLVVITGNSKILELDKWLQRKLDSGLETELISASKIVNSNNNNQKSFNDELSEFFNNYIQNGNDNLKYIMLIKDSITNSKLNIKNKKFQSKNLDKRVTYKPSSKNSKL